jgi:hypothetical protein
MRIIPFPLENLAKKPTSSELPLKARKNPFSLTTNARLRQIPGKLLMSRALA